MELPEDTEADLCRAATKNGYGRRCRAVARRNGYCDVHDPGADAEIFGFSRAEMTRLEMVDQAKKLLTDYSEGLTLAQIRSAVSQPRYLSAAAGEDFEQVLRRDADVTETTERRVNGAGRMQVQVVLRLTPTGDDSGR